MKQSQISLIVIGFILVALMATNPSTAEHKETVKEKVSAAFENNNSDGNAFQKLGEQLGLSIGMVIIDKMIKRENYILFSLTKSTYLDNDEKTKIVGLGIFGKVYLSEKLNSEITEKIDRSKPPIIGFPFRIENIEIAENDFPEIMNYDEAVKKCNDLGNGWRLPNKYEWSILYKNKDKIGGFDNGYYWSSSIADDGIHDIWLQTFSLRWESNSYKNGTAYVRAIRSF